MKSIWLYQLTERQITALIRCIEADHREVEQFEEGALNEIHAALHAYVEP